MGMYREGLGGREVYKLSFFFIKYCVSVYDGT